MRYSRAEAIARDHLPIIKMRITLFLPCLDNTKSSAPGKGFSAKGWLPQRKKAGANHLRLASAWKLDFLSAC
jgi:hypothetical protein